MRKENLERENKRLETESDRYLKRKEMYLNFEVQKFKIENGVFTSEPDINKTCPINSELSFKKLIPEFDPNQTDISLYLVLFQSQIKRVKFSLENWIYHLISLLPTDVCSIHHS